jgi:hypothetical protein
LGLNVEPSQYESGVGKILSFDIYVPWVMDLLSLHASGKQSDYRTTRYVFRYFEEFAEDIGSDEKELEATGGGVVGN